MMVMQAREMKYWGGNYDTYRRTREEQDVNQVTIELIYLLGDFCCSVYVTCWKLIIY